MSSTLQIIIVAAIVAGAGWYLYRRFKRMLDPNQPACGCGCGKSCAAQPPAEAEENKAHITPGHN